jgi:hypothetical protein
MTRDLSSFLAIFGVAADSDLERGVDAPSYAAPAARRRPTRRTVRGTASYWRTETSSLERLNNARTHPMNDTISVAAPALNVDPRVHDDHSAPHRRGGAWRRHMAIAAAGLAIVASAAGLSDRAAAAGQDNLAWTEGNGQPVPDEITVTSKTFTGYIKKADLGKLVLLGFVWVIRGAAVVM